MSRSMDPIVLPGRVEARNEAALAFRIAGRMVERSVNVGDVVAPGQVVARLDPQNELNALSSAQAALAAAEGQLGTARNAFERQRQLLDRGLPRAPCTTRRNRPSRRRPRRWTTQRRG